MNPNHVLAAAICVPVRRRARLGERGRRSARRSSRRSIIDRVVADLGRRLFEVPVGFKWFVDGLVDGSIGFGGEESAGASFLRRDGERLDDRQGRHHRLPAGGGADRATLGRDPAEVYAGLTERFGAPAYRRDRRAGHARRRRPRLGRLRRRTITATTLGGDPITAVLTAAPGNGAPIGGLKVTTGEAWFAARPSGTENVTKLYAESFRGEEHLGRVLDEAAAIVAAAAS